MATLSIVLPSYNEEQNIAHTAQTLSELLRQEQIDYELIFVSDGSRTAPIRRYRRRRSRTHISGEWSSRAISARRPASSRACSYQREMRLSSWTATFNTRPR